jgi:hypothetical protein
MTIDPFSYNYILTAIRMPFARHIVGGEYRNARRSYRGGKMLHPGIVADQQQASTKDHACLFQGCSTSQVNRIAADAFGNFPANLSVSTTP